VEEFKEERHDGYGHGMARLLVAWIDTDGIWTSEEFGCIYVVEMHEEKRPKRTLKSI